MKNTSRRGFSIVELMVVISIIAILSSILYANFGNARGSGRDAKRQSDVRNLQTAIELYKKEFGRYPTEGCADSNSDGFSSEVECGALPYVIGLAPTFISVLPRDPRRGTAQGYAYNTNATSTVFKVMAINTVEGPNVTATHALLSCDIGTSGLCVPPSVTVTPAVCLTTDSRFQRSFGAWGGFADGANDTAVRTNTAAVICQ